MTLRRAVHLQHLLSWPRFCSPASTPSGTRASIASVPAHLASEMAGFQRPPAGPQHSHQQVRRLPLHVTRTPFYGHFAPISWLLERDILEGRDHMNLSTWDTYSADQQETFKAKIVQETKSHEMPLPQYRIIHWNSTHHARRPRRAYPVGARHRRSRIRRRAPRRRHPRPGRLRETLHRLPLPHRQPRRPAPPIRLWPRRRRHPQLPLLGRAQTVAHHLERRHPRAVAHRSRRLPPRQQHGLPRRQTAGTRRPHRLVQAIRALDQAFIPTTHRNSRPSQPHPPSQLTAIPTTPTATHGHPNHTRRRNSPTTPVPTTVVILDCARSPESPYFAFALAP